MTTWKGYEPGSKEALEAAERYEAPPTILEPGEPGYEGPEERLARQAQEAREAIAVRGKYWWEKPGDYEGIQLDTKKSERLEKLKEKFGEEEADYIDHWASQPTIEWDKTRYGLPDKIRHEIEREREQRCNDLGGISSEYEPLRDYIQTLEKTPQDKWESILRPKGLLDYELEKLKNSILQKRTPGNIAGEVASLRDYWQTHVEKSPTCVAPTNDLFEPYIAAGGWVSSYKYIAENPQYAIDLLKGNREYFWKTARTIQRVDTRGLRLAEKATIKKALENLTAAYELLKPRVPTVPPGYKEAPIRPAPMGVVKPTGRPISIPSREEWRAELTAKYRDPKITQALNKAISTVIDYALYPAITLPAMMNWQWQELDREIGGGVIERKIRLGEELNEKDKDRLAEFVQTHWDDAPVKDKIKAYLPGGEKHAEFMALPWYKRLEYEAPAWILFALIVPSATVLRGQLAPVAAKGGVKGAAATVARGALAPVSGYEWAAGKVISLPIKGVSALTNKALTSYVNKHAVYLSGVARRPAQTPVEKLLQKVLEYHGRWLTQMSDNIIKARGASEVARAAGKVAGKATTQEQALLLDAGIRASTQTMGNIILATQAGKELTSVSLTALIAKNTPADFVKGITGIIAGRVAPAVAKPVAEVGGPVTRAIEVGDIVSDGLIQGRVIGEGTLGTKQNPIPAYKVEVLTGHEKGQVSAILKDQARLIRPSETIPEGALPPLAKPEVAKPTTKLAAEQAFKAGALVKVTEAVTEQPEALFAKGWRYNQVEKAWYEPVEAKPAEVSPVSNLQKAIDEAEARLTKIGEEWIAGRPGVGLTKNQIARAKAGVAQVAKKYNIDKNTLWENVWWEAEAPKPEIPAYPSEGEIEALIKGVTAKVEAETVSVAIGETGTYTPETIAGVEDWITSSEEFEALGVAKPVGEVAPRLTEAARLENRRLEIKELLTEPAKNLPEGITKVGLRKELGEVSSQIVPVEKKLRQTIMATVKVKSLPQSQYRKIFLEKGGARQLSSVAYTGLNKILEAVRTARPIKVKGKIVLKPTTERNIQTLKNILFTEKKITPGIYEGLKKDLKLPTDRFENANRFITESEAKKLIREMNYEAESGLAEWDARVSEVVSSRPELKSAIDDLSSRIVKENPATRLQRTINWRKFAIEISEVPNDVGLSGTMSILRALRRFQEQLGGRGATRIYDVAEMMVERRQLNDVVLARKVSEMKAEVPELSRVAQNKESIEKIQQWLDSEIAGAKVKKPTLTNEELRVAQLFRREYDQWKDAVRLERFKDAYYHYHGNAELIKNGTERTGDVAMPDAPLPDIKEAIKIYEGRGETALANYLKTKTWGVLKSGYSFTQVIHPQLKLGERWAVRATTTSLHQRKGLDFRKDERTPWERLIAYERQMVGMNLQPYFRKMDREFGHIVESGKLSNPSAAANKISTFLQETKGFPIESPVVRILLRVGGWSFGTLAKVPWMSVRNVHQNIAFHPDKSEVIKAIFTGGFYADPLTRNGRLDYTATLVHQFKAAMEEQLLMGYMGRTPLENLIRRTDYYHLSDKLNRYLSMAGSGAKAETALKQYLKDGDVQRFLRNSGANELSQTEQLRILEYLSLKNYDYGGVLEAVSGGEASIRDIGKRITTLNHFNYVRYLRSSIEMGETGRVLGSLIAFPRSVAEKYVDIFSRLKPARGLTGNDRKRAIHSLLALVIGSAIASAMLNATTGKKRDAYNPFLVLQWQIGGLAVGATENLTELYRQLSNLTFARDEGDKKYALEQLAILIPGLGDSFIPFYGPTMNLIESLTDSRYLDRLVMRKVRAMFDESYKPNEEFYEIERTMLEKIQHALFGAITPDPTDLEAALKKLQGIEANLGQIDNEELDKSRQRAAETGIPFEYVPEDFTYMVSNLGSDINSAISGLDPSEITMENGFNQLVLDYMEYQEMFETYKAVPTDKRYDYRAQNPETDANLFFWGYVTTLQSDTARQLVTQMINRYGIPDNAIKGYEKEAPPPPFPESGLSSTKPSGVGYKEWWK